MLLLPETRVTATKQRVVAARAHEAGWQAFWGAPLESQGSGTWDCPQRGVGILVKHRVNVPEGDTAMDLWLHAVVPSPGCPWHCNNTFHAQAVYWVPSQPALNRPLWEAVV